MVTGTITCQEEKRVDIKIVERVLFLNRNSKSPANENRELKED